jgi:UDP:flavonoid glycosyltransferase YjiC (YdhE family)
MARYLAYTSPARGHLYPIVATLIELRRRGHEVAMRTLGPEVARMQQLGFAAAPIAPAIEAIEQDDYEARTPMGANKRVMNAFARRAEHEVGDVQAAITEVDPDAVLIDINCQGAATVAEAGERAWAMWTPYFTPLPSRDAPPFGLGIHPRRDLVGTVRDALIEKLVLGPPERQAASNVNPLRARFGLAPFRRGTELWATAPLHLYFTAEPFEYPRTDWPESFRLLGPGTWEPPAAPPDWLERTERPLVLVTLSTEFQDDGRLARVALQALADEDVDVVVTTAAVDPSGFDAPANARVERFIPHGPLLARAACVVCHGGMGITQRALAAGVPVCVVPFGRDQLEVAGHVTWCDAGTRLAPQRLRPDRLRAAVRAATAKRQQAQTVAAAFAATGGAKAGADALEKLVDATPAHPRHAVHPS